MSGYMEQKVQSEQEACVDDMIMSSYSLFYNCSFTFKLWKLNLILYFLSALFFYLVVLS
jgi:hypothetical protein